MTPPGLLEVDKPSERSFTRELSPAVAVVTVEGSKGSLFVDGEPRGTVPGPSIPVCEGSRLIEVRTDHGRSVHRVKSTAGQNETIKADGRPALAILATAGLTDGFGPDLRIKLEQQLNSRKTGLTLFATEPAKALLEMNKLKLETGWLAFATDGTPIGPYQSSRLPPSQLAEYSATLSEIFEAQGVAELTVSQCPGFGESAADDAGGWQFEAGDDCN